jgi:hypothetical protein
MKRLREAGDCAFGLILIGITFALGYGLMATVFNQTVLAASLN